MINFVNYNEKSSDIILQCDKFIFNRILLHGNSSQFDEVCGVGIGNKNNNIWKILDFITVDNVVKKEEFANLRKNLNISPRTDYIPHPMQFINILRKTKHFDTNNKKELVMLFHTHPKNHAIPSLKDVQGAGYNAVYVIFSPRYQEISFNLNNGITQEFSNVRAEIL